MEARMFAVVSFTQDVVAGRPKYDPPKALFAMTVVEMHVEAREPTHGDHLRAGLALEGMSGVRG